MEDCYFLILSIRVSSTALQALILAIHYIFLLSCKVGIKEATPPTVYMKVKVENLQARLYGKTLPAEDVPEGLSSAQAGAAVLGAGCFMACLHR